MGAVNKVILIGNLGIDPEIRHTTAGQTVCNFRIATSETWKDKEGVKQEKTEWIPITVWGSQAEFCGKYLSKGSLVYVQGKFTTTSYEKDNVKIYRTEVVAQSVKSLSTKSESSQGQSSTPQFNSDEQIPF